MNSLSWFLYMADVLPTAFRAPLVILSLFAIVCLVMFFVALGVVSDGDVRNEADYAKRIAFKNGVNAYCKWLIPLWVTVVVIHSMIPSKETIYLIAGSEVGEVIVNSPEAREILDDVKTVIKQQIKGDDDEE